MKKDVNIYQPKGTKIYYATYRTEVNHPEQGEIIVQRNISTGLINRLAAQRWANDRRKEDVRNFVAGKEIESRSPVSCGEIIDCYLEHCQQTSANKVVKAFCILVAEGLGQLDLKPEERETFVRSVQLSALSADHVNDWREENLLGRRTAANIHAIMRTGKGIFAQHALGYYRKLSSFHRGYPANVKEWKTVSKPKQAGGEDETFQPIDETILAEMDLAARKDKPADSVMLQWSREQDELARDGEAARWRNAWAAYWLMRRCGLRNSEVENLRWEWFEVSGSKIELALIRRPYWQPKYSGGRVPVAQDLYAALLEVLGPSRQGAEGYVLYGEERDRYAAVNEYLNKFVRRYLPERAKGAYELRKQYGSEMAAKYDIATAARLLRHKGLETAYKHYYTPLKGVQPL
jgi:hypothetical protein